MYMKNIFRIMLLLTTMLFVSCGDDDEVKLPDTKDVNYANIAGSWRLSEWNGENLEGDTRYYYITFDRKGKDGKRSYTIYTNLNSATSEQIPGSFLLSKEDDYGDIISGTYYYQLDTDDEWEYSYIVSGLTDTSMIWTAKEDTGEIKSGQINAGDGFEYWLMKFDGVSKNGDHNLEDSVEYTRIEYGYYLMAKAAGVIMNECRLLEDAGYAHFITKRFDRNNNKKIHMQTLGAISHIDYNIPGLCSYEQAAYYMNRLGIPYSDVEQFYRRMVFNVILINQDDHVKNVSFLMDKNGVWRLSPAYDVTFAYDSSNMWLKAHQMLINGKSSDISYGDLIKCGINMGVSKRKCDAIISYIEDVAKRFSDYMEMAGVREKTCQIMNDIIISNNIRKTGD